MKIRIALTVEITPDPATGEGAPTIGVDLIGPTHSAASRFTPANEVPTQGQYLAPELDLDPEARPS